MFWVFFNTVKEKNNNKKTKKQLKKKVNALSSKGVSNMCLKVTIEKKWRTQNPNFLSLKYSSPGQFLGALTHADIIEFLNLL